MKNTNLSHKLKLSIENTFYQRCNAESMACWSLTMMHCHVVMRCNKLLPSPIALRVSQDECQPNYQFERIFKPPVSKMTDRSGETIFSETCGWICAPSPIAASWLLFQTPEVSAHLLLWLGPSRSWWWSGCCRPWTQHGPARQSDGKTVRI